MTFIFFVCLGIEEIGWDGFGLCCNVFFGRLPLSPLLNLAVDVWELNDLSQHMLRDSAGFVLIVDH